MVKVRGTLRKAGLEGGLWVLESDGGTTYELRGGPRDGYRDGARVEVEGEVDRRAAGIGMTGETIAVRSLRVL